MKNDLQHLMPVEIIRLARFCSAAMTILNARLFTLVGLLMSAAAFGYALWQPDYIRLASACAFALMAILKKQRERATEHAEATSKALTPKARGGVGVVKPGEEQESRGATGTIRGNQSPSIVGSERRRKEWMY